MHIRPARFRFLFPFSILLILSLLTSTLYAYNDKRCGGDDELFILPGDEPVKPKKPKKKKTQFHSGPKLLPKYGPYKEWQSFRSTALITCAARYHNTLWAGTAGSGLIRWNLRTKGYRFYVPQIRDERAKDILALAVAKNGDLWIGTNGYGIALLKKGRSKWKFYQYRDGLPGNVVQAIAIAPNGDVWAGTRRGVARFHRRRWRRYTVRNGLPSPDVRAIGVSSDGRVWFSPNIANPFYRRGRRFVTIRSFPVVGSTCIVSDRKGGLWFCNDQGAVHYKNGRGRLYTTEHGLAGSFVQSIYVDRSGGTWFGLRQNGITYFRDGRWVSMGLYQGLSGMDIRGIVGGYNGKIYATTHLNGAVEYQNGRWKRLPVGISGNRINQISCAPDGSVWIGTSSGASRYFKGYWYNYTNVLPNPDVRGFAFDPAGNTWIGTFGGGVVKFNGKKWKVFEMLDGLASNKIVGAGITPEGIWFAHEQKGASLYTAGHWKTFNRRNTRYSINPAYLIQKLYIDPQYGLWLGTRGGGVINYPLRGRWHQIRQMRGAATKGMVNDIAVDAKRRVWFATKNGLYRYFRGRLKRFSTRDGLPDNNVLAVAIEKNKIWLGTKKGVAVFDGMSWRTFSKETGLASDHITVIAITPWGEKWFGTAHDGITIYRGE